MSQFKKGQRVRVLSCEGAYVDDTPVTGQVSVQTDYARAVIRVPVSLLEPIVEPVKVGDTLDKDGVTHLPVGSVVQGAYNFRHYAVGLYGSVSALEGGEWSVVCGEFNVLYLPESA